MTNGVNMVAHFVKDHISKSVHSRSGSGDSRGVIFLREHGSTSAFLWRIIPGLGLEPKDYSITATDDGDLLVFDYEGHGHAGILIINGLDPRLNSQEFGWAVIEMEMGTPTADVKSELSALLERVKCPLAKRHDVLYYRPLKGREGE